MSVPNSWTIKAHIEFSIYDTDVDANSIKVTAKVNIIFVLMFLLSLLSKLM